jgi:hypothetical protein
VEYQQIAAGWFFPVSSTDVFCHAFVWRGVFWNGAGGGWLVFVFGTLLGPEATGPWRGVRGLFGLRGSVVRVCVFLVSWLHCFRALVVVPFLWGWPGAGGVVRGCCLRTT